MNNKPFMVVHYSDFFYTHTKIIANYPTAKEALEKAAFHMSCFWVHRVEVWHGDFRLLLAVY